MRVRVKDEVCYVLVIWLVAHLAHDVCMRSPSNQLLPRKYEKSPKGESR